MTSLRGKCAIVGVGETRIGKLPNVGTLTLHVEAAKHALDDAGLKASQIDGLLTNQPLHDPFRTYSVVVAHAMGITPRYTTDLALGGATPVAMAIHAAMAIEAGLATTVMCVHGRNQASLHLLPKNGVGTTREANGGIRDGAEDYEQPYGFMVGPGHHAFAASRHMHEYGTTSEQLGAIAVSTRKHANLTPTATMYGRPMTLEDHQNSRFIVAPLRLMDCSLVSDGGGAFIVTSADRAKDLRKPPAYIMGFGSNNPHAQLVDAKTLTTLGGKVSSETAYKMAGVGPGDMDFAQIYDCFTITTLITLEDYGFCSKGDGGAWVQGGRIELGGELPVNTHGGLLSHGHLEGITHVNEAVRQLRGDDVEPERQVEGAEVGIVSGHGGNLSTHATLILSNRRN
ncbi:MAG: thiolase family protein [Actinobacteria bacterium]|nr:thiolase family protein [Actinomycetota bacterium]